MGRPVAHRRHSGAPEGGAAARGRGRVRAVAEARAVTLLLSARDAK